MDDFSTPGKLNNYSILPLPANFVRPRERPLSSMVPTIVLDEHKDPRLILGAAGGPKITTAVAQVMNFQMSSCDNCPFRFELYKSNFTAKYITIDYFI